MKTEMTMEMLKRLLSVCVSKKEAENLLLHLGYEFYYENGLSVKYIRTSSCPENEIKIGFNSSFGHIYTHSETVRFDFTK